MDRFHCSAYDISVTQPHLFTQPGQRPWKGQVGMLHSTFIASRSNTTDSQTVKQATNNEGHRLPPQASKVFTMEWGVQLAEDCRLRSSQVLA